MGMSGLRFLPSKLIWKMWGKQLETVSYPLFTMRTDKAFWCKAVDKSNFLNIYFYKETEYHDLFTYYYVHTKMFSSYWNTYTPFKASTFESFERRRYPLHWTVILNLYFFFELS